MDDCFTSANYFRTDDYSAEGLQTETRGSGICLSFAIEAKPLELYVPAEQSGIRYHIWRLVTSGPFENLVMLLIIGNTILLMLKVLLF